MTTIHTYIDTPLGQLLLASRDHKLSRMVFADEGQTQVGPDWLRRDEALLFRQAARQLEEYAAGERWSFDLPVLLSGTPFQIEVWQAIAAIPFGQTVSYGELAAQLGWPRAMRAVGTAAGKNPLCLVVPCHRVIGKSGALTGYAGGLARKRRLLDFEAGKSPLELPELLSA